MIVEYIRYDLTTHAAEELIEAYRSAAVHLEAAPECAGFELTRCEEAPGSLVMRILWRSTGDHMRGFRKGPNFPPFLALVRPYVGEIVEMRHYAATGVKWGDQG